MGPLRRNVLWVILAASSWNLAQEPPPASPSPAVDPRALVEEAARAFEAADFEKALQLVLQAKPSLETSSDSGLQARAWDVLGQSQFNLGKKKEAEATVLRLIRLIPGFPVDPAVAGPEYVKFYETRRKKLTGVLAPVCKPFPCEAVLVNGQPGAIDSQGGITVLAGEYALTLSRRGFRPQVLPPVKVEAGARVPVEAQLEQIARDVVFITHPAGVKVFLDGREIGTSIPGDSEDVSRPFVIEDLYPGPHTLVLQAPCRRRVEQMLDVVLDAKNPGPFDQGTIVLERARSWIEVRWAETEGVLTLDGEPRSAGRIEVCPGKREVSLNLGGRRVWFEVQDLGEAEEVVLEPKPRPTLAPVGSITSLLPNFPGGAWSVLTLDSAAANLAERVVASRLTGQGSIPAFPRFVRLPLGSLAPSLLASAPEADLWLVAPARSDDSLPGQILAWLDPRRELMEVTSLNGGSVAVGRAVGEFLKSAPEFWTVFTGLDLVSRRNRPALAAHVEPGSPAAMAGILAGEEVLASGGKSVATPREITEWENSLKPGEPVTLRIRSVSAGEREVTLTPQRVLAVSNPVLLTARPLLPELAFCEVLKLAGDPARRIGSAVRFALILGALDRPEALAALDRAVVDDAFDPFGDVRGTLGIIQERLLREASREDYAEEVRGRWKGWLRARYGGRQGPPLRFFP